MKNKICFINKSIDILYKVKKFLMNNINLQYIKLEKMGEQIAWKTNFEDVKERDQFPNDNQELNANLMGGTNHHNAHVFA